MLLLYLEICRGLAAFWVFLFHCKNLYSDSMPWLLPFADHGHLGVPMFFVISGYVITHSAESNRRKGLAPTDFLKRRFRRVYPVFWASVAVVLLLPFIIEWISALKTGQYSAPYLRYAQFSAGDWLGILTLLRVFDGDPSLQSLFSPLNSVYWTLAIEFQFYIVISLLLYLGSSYHWALLGVSAVGLLVAASGPIFGIYGLFFGYWPAFSFGIILAYLHRDGKFFHQFGSLRPLLGILTVAASVFLFIAFPETTYRNSTLFAFFFACFIWMTAGLETNLAQIQNNHRVIAKLLLKPLLTLGAMSYSVYLLHGKLFQLPEMFVRQVVSINNPLYAIFTFLGTLALCYVMYLFVERRFMSGGYQKMHIKLRK